MSILSYPTFILMFLTPDWIIALEQLKRSPNLFTVFWIINVSSILCFKSFISMLFDKAKNLSRICLIIFQLKDALYGLLCKPCSSGKNRKQVYYSKHINSTPLNRKCQLPTLIIFHVIPLYTVLLMLQFDSSFDRIFFPSHSSHGCIGKIDRYSCSLALICSEK